MIELNFYGDDGEIRFTVQRIPDDERGPDEIILIMSDVSDTLILTDRELRFLNSFLGGY